jgi:hypothetical protein
VNFISLAGKGAGGELTRTAKKDAIQLSFSDSFRWGVQDGSMNRNSQAARRFLFF